MTVEQTLIVESAGSPPVALDLTPLMAPPSERPAAEKRRVAALVAHVAEAYSTHCDTADDENDS